MSDAVERPAAARARRLFFAAWPQADARAALATLQGRHCAAAARPVPVERLHLTLLFLGDVDADREAAIRRAAADIRVDAFDLVLARLGGVSRRGLAWSSPETVPAPLVELVAALRALALDAGVVVESRRYAPHVTLARRAGKVQATPHPPLAWRIDRFTLVHSEALAAGVRYHVVQTWPLR